MVNRWDPCRPCTTSQCISPNPTIRQLQQVSLSLFSPCHLRRSDAIVTGDKVDKVIIVTDIFGIYPNTKLLADEWAGQEYEVLVPDLFEGSPVDHGLLNVRPRSPPLPTPPGHADDLLDRPSCPTIESKLKRPRYPKRPILPRRPQLLDHSWFPIERPVSWDPPRYKAMTQHFTDRHSCQAETRSICQSRPRGSKHVSSAVEHSETYS